MSPITNKKDAKEGGFAQIRAALQKFEGDVIGAEFGKWGGQLIDKDGKPVPVREFLEITCENVEVLEVSEELSMPLTDYNFRVNCSDFKGSFWVELFLESADKFKILIPDGLVGKRLVFEKQTLEAKDPTYNTTNYVIAGVKTAKAKKANTTPQVGVGITSQAGTTSAGTVAETGDPMELIKKLADGKTEAQFKMAVALHPFFVNNPLLSLAKSGMLTQALVNEGKLVLVGDKYHIPKV